MPITSSPRVAFFGATGGCTRAALVRTVKAGIYCSALARTPDKLTEALRASEVPQDLIDRFLVIIQGDVKDLKTVEQTLVAPSGSSSPHQAVDVIISGIGSYPTLQWSILKPVGLQDPNITQRAMNTIIRSLQNVQSKDSHQERPLICVISTTGVSRHVRDVPLAFLALYHWLLAVPHEDKAAMESIVTGEAEKAESCLGGAVVVRPSLLMDGPGKDLSSVRVGWEGQDGPGPAVGYTITRDLVGNWIFDNVIRGTDREQWAGRRVTLTE